MRVAAKLVLVVLASCALLVGADKSSADLKFVVVRKEGSHKPVRNASVVLHPVAKNGKQKKGGLELKTDPEGHAVIEGMPVGKMRVQVIAPGFKTYGEDFNINQPVHEITIKLQKPSNQYSIYK